MSKSYQKIALYLTQNPNDVAVLSVNAIGAKCGIHASSFVRYAQSLGYKGFKELQAVFQRRLSTAAPGFDARVRALEAELGGAKEESLAFLPILSPAMSPRCRICWPRLIRPVLPPRPSFWNRRIRSICWASCGPSRWSSCCAMC
ncbi:MurR/RpiR family transcriptional regulator [Gemmobacter lanyuensis]